MINIDDIKQSKSGSIREAVTDYFRTAILTGQIAPGTTLPSSRELASQLDTSFPNVHHGLTPLVKEGLIKRCRKAGTTVCDRPKKLQSIAIYLFHYKLDDIPQFLHTLIDITTGILEEKGIESRLIIDNLSLHGFQQLEELVKTNQVQGIIAPVIGKEKALFNKLSKLPVPLSYLPSATVPGPIKIDFQQMQQLALDGLKQAGCERVGIICSLERFSANKQEDKFYRDFSKLAKAAGLTLQEKWLISGPSESNYLKTSSMATDFAFQSCEQLLSMPAAERPDGLFVFPDGLITGIMLSIMKQRISIPEEMKLVVARNWEIEVPILVPCGTVGLTISDVARNLISNINDEFNGKKIQKTVIPYHFRPHQLSNEFIISEV